jgi:hypothetical protein
MRLNNIYISLLFSICFMLINKLCPAQSQPDAGMWNTFSIEKEITKKFSVSIDEELRLKENFSRLNLLYTNFGLNLKIIKGFKASLTYRLIEKYNIDNMFGFRNRLMLDLSYKYRIRKISLSYRSRFQSEFKNYHSTELGKIPEWFWRNKFEIKYNSEKYEPYIGTEIRYQIRDPRNPDFDMGWHRIRMFAGLDYNITKKQSIGIYYLIQRELSVDDPQDLYILGLQYSFTL